MQAHPPETLAASWLWLHSCASLVRLGFHNLSSDGSALRHSGPQSMQGLALQAHRPCQACMPS